MKTLNETYIVLHYFNENESNYLISKRENFKEVPLCETYKDYGQKLGCYDAGCFSLDNNDSDARESMLKALYENFKIDYTEDDMELYEETIDGINDRLEGIEKDKIVQFIETWKKENEYHPEVTSYTFWNGSNFESVIIKADSDLELELIETDEETSSEILAEFEKAEKDPGYPVEERGTGYRGCTVMKYDFTYSIWEGAWEIATVRHNN